MTAFRQALVADYEGREGRPHAITIATVADGFDWWCSCRLISEGQWNGDSWPEAEVAERDAVRAHADEGNPIKPWEAPV